MELIDIQVLHKDGDGYLVDDKDLLEAIDRGVRKYGNDATIYNLSVSKTEGVQELIVNEATELIDDLSSKKDVLFVCAAGNQNGNFPLGYDAIFNTTGIDSHIASPSDAMNALSVGSVTSTADVNSICSDINFPSPFTRKGGVRNDIKKPELVAIGGNIKIDPSDKYDKVHLENSQRTYGVPIIDCLGFNRAVGTSFSAPLISREAARLLDYLKKSSIPDHLPEFKNNKANIVKTLLIHSTKRVQQSLMNSDGLKRAYGFGLADYQSVLRDNENQITLVYADKINFIQKRQKILIKLPTYLLGKALEFTFTFVYNPPVNKNFREYKMIDLQPSIGFIKPELDQHERPTGKTKFTGINPSASWDNYRYGHFNTHHFATERKRLTSLDFQILVQMMVSNRLLSEKEGKEEKIDQNYALALTIKDTSESGQLRKEILNTNQFFELIENTVQIQQ